MGRFDVVNLNMDVTKSGSDEFLLSGLSRMAVVSLFLLRSVPSLILRLLDSLMLPTVQITSACQLLPNHSPHCGSSRVAPSR